MKKLLLGLGLVGATLAFCTMNPAAMADIPLVYTTGSFSSNASAAVCSPNLSGQSTVFVQVVGSGTLTVDVTGTPPGSSTSTNLTVYSTTGTTVGTGSFTPTSGSIYQLSPAGILQICVAPDTVFSGTATVYVWGSSSSGTVPAQQASGGPGAIASPLCQTGSAVCTYDLHSPLPSSPLPIASAGVAAQTTYPYFQGVNLCVVPAGAAQVVSAGNTTFVRCDTTGGLITDLGWVGPCSNPTIAQSFATVALTNTSSAQLVALASNEKIYVCSLVISTAGVTAVTIEQGTATACASNTATFAVYQLTTGIVVTPQRELYPGQSTTAYELCAVQSQSVNTNVTVTYVQQ